jgi:3-oxoacyl-[acyl-carrier protein] reductase
MSLQGKVAVVTGGSRGIGRAISLGLGAAGAQVVVASRTETDVSDRSDYPRYAAGTITDTARDIAAAGGEALPVRCDVSDTSDLQRLVAETLQHFGRIDILVSNAGIDCESPVVDLDVDLLDRCLAVNVRGPILLCKYVLPAMVSQRSGGSIFCVTSGAARGYRPGRVGYSMSKAALDRTFLSLAEEVREHDIAVNVFSPGRVDTWMNRRGAWPGTEHIPMVPPEVVAPSAVWLAGVKAHQFTGQMVERADFGVSWGPVDSSVEGIDNLETDKGGGP